MMAGRSREPGRSVTSEVLSSLEAFEKSRGVLSLTDIAEKSWLPLSTAHRLVNELTDWGLLSREPNGRYQLGIRLAELARIREQGYASTLEEVRLGSARSPSRCSIPAGSAPGLGWFGTHGAGND